MAPLLLLLFFGFALGQHEDMSPGAAQCTETRALELATTMTAAQGAGLPEMVRQDWESMSGEDRAAFLNALVALNGNGLLESFQCFHWRQTEARKEIADIHETEQFLPWHRAYLAVFERSLGVPIPYWAFDYDSADLKNAPLFTSDQLGNNNNRPGCADFSGGILEGLSFSAAIYEGAGCVARSPAAAPGNVYDDNYMAGLINHASFDEFRGALNGPHGSYHNFWGEGGGAGFMMTHGSPRDPMFWLYHSNIERHFWLWQQNHPPSSAPYSGGEKIKDYDAMTSAEIYDPSFFNVKYGPPHSRSRIEEGAGTGAAETIVANQDTSQESRKRAANSTVVASCLATFSKGFGVSPPPPASSFLGTYLSDRDEPKNSFRLILEAEVGDDDTSNTTDDELVLNIIESAKFDDNLDHYLFWGHLYEQFDLCSQGGLPARISERGFLMGSILQALRKDDEFRTAIALLPRIFGRSAEPGVDASSMHDLKQAGRDLSTLFFTLIGFDQTAINSNLWGKKRAVSIPTAWKCNPRFYGALDGCDCGCGAPDPDCEDQRPRDSFKGEPVPVLGCDGAGARCKNGTCTYSPAPSTWKCQERDYNSTNGCDCGCGTYDPDCSIAYPPRYVNTIPYLYDIYGCSNGVGPSCSKNGTCAYTRKPAPGWTCPTRQYGSGDACDCGCGAFDPDCNNPRLEVSGCSCPGMTCSNGGGLCVGTCNGLAVELKASRPNLIEAQPRIFNYTEYLAFNPDLPAAEVSTEAKALQHWITWGITDGRQASMEFDPPYYSEIYPDVPRVYGSGNGRAISHYTTYGITEKRIGSPFSFSWAPRLFMPYIFDHKYYLNRYSDLIKGNVVNELTAKKHWIKYGIYEGRRGSAAFDPVYYLNNNPDVKAIFGPKGYLGGLIHYVDHGRSENRKGSA